MTPHTLAVASLWLSFALLMALLVAVVTFTEPGAYERYRHAVAYHRHHARHAARGEATETTTRTALTARTA